MNPAAGHAVNPTTTYAARLIREKRKHNQRGFAAIEFVLGIGLLLLPVGLLVAVLPTWSERQQAATVAATEAARTYVLTRDPQSAQNTADQIAANYHLKPDEYSLNLNGDPSDRGSNISATVTVRVPATVIPIMHANADAFSFTESHSEVVDLYRSLP